MIYFRLRETLLLLPLLIVWILYQRSYLNRSIKFESHDRFPFELLNSTNKNPQMSTQKKPSHSMNWIPPALSEENYEDDFHEFLKPVDNNLKTRSARKLWFMKEGNIRPEKLSINLQNELWPEQNKGDRIVEQLMYIPTNYSNEWNLSCPLAKLRLYNSNKYKLKKIVLFGKLDRNDVPQERYFKEAEVLMRSRPGQIWILYLREPPSKNAHLGRLRYVINWTASYRHDSDIVIPYGKFVPYELTNAYSQEKDKIKKIKNKNYALHKSKKVAWFVEHCEIESDRSVYAKYLGRYIDVDIYGPCGTKCPYDQRSKCFELLDKDYKFYLSFEKCKSREYITENFFEDGLGHDVLPIVMGPPREDYERVAPPNSFIHVDDFDSPKELAEYLYILDGNDEMYNKYFNWKGTGEFIDTYFWCRVCALLHSPYKLRSYKNIQKWWTGSGFC